jgi:glycosyltransferase involved in cell wall biosynthesis
VTDAWKPQVNGVVQTLEQTGRELQSMGHLVRYETPGDRTIPLPTYPEIRLAVLPRGRLRRSIRELAPDAIHIATEGPLGFAARAICKARGIGFTTSFNTRFPEYLQMRIPWIPQEWSYAGLRAFHRPAQATMVSTPSLMKELAGRGFGRLRLWSRGVDIEHFSPLHHAGPEDFFPELPRPLFLCVGRVAVEKNIEAFLRLDLPGTKLVVGDGPQRADLQARFPEARFLGRKTGAELAVIYASCDVFVFPSRTDTFGLVLLEALASGTPVAAYPVTGPVDVLTGTTVGILREDLREASLEALKVPRQLCRSFAENYSWRVSAEQFIGNLAHTN